MIEEKDIEQFRTELEVFAHHIREAGLRRTEQRERILLAFLKREGHITSEDLYFIVSEEDPSIGLTTVYRTMKLLTEAGLAREVRFGDNRTYYEHHFNHDHHDHMICTECGLVIEFFSQEIEELQDKMASSFKFKPTHHSLRMWGLCEKCQEQGEAANLAPAGAQPKVRVQREV